LTFVPKKDNRLKLFDIFEGFTVKKTAQHTLTFLFLTFLIGDFPLKAMDKEKDVEAGYHTRSKKTAEGQERSLACESSSSKKRKRHKAVTEEIPEKIKQLTKKANRGNVEAQKNLVSIYLRKGVEQNQEKAFFWVEKLLESGDADAQYKWGFRHLKGLGLSKNAEEAMRYFQLAATQNHSEARCQLAIGYLKGNGVHKDPETAKTMLQKLSQELPRRHSTRLICLMYLGDTEEVYKFF